MRKYFLLLLLIPLLFIKIPKYIELNDLMIIKSIEINCENKTINLKEIIPTKEDNSIEYKYKTHKYNYNNINEINKIINNKKFYIKYSKYIIKGCPKDARKKN